MIYPANFEQKIDFHQIRALLKQHCLSTLGEKMVDRMEIQYDVQKIDMLQQQAEEFRQIILFDSTFPSQDYFDIKAELKRIRKDGTFIDLEKLGEMRASLKTISACIDYFQKRDENTYPALLHITRQVHFDRTYIADIEQIIDDKGEVKDNASPNLLIIRGKIRKIENEIGKNIRRILQENKQAKLIDETAEITYRAGRLVFPVPAVNKRKIKGVVLGQSSTGQTYFIEPQETFEANNELQNLQSEERHEIIQILTQYTTQLRPHLPDIENYFSYLAKIDFIAAKAKFAVATNACKPIITEKQAVNWKEAVHPLMYLNFKQQNRTLVPLTITLGENCNILIVSGPNAGGKSVCLKTLALLQYMFQCGIPVSASPLSEFGVFKDIFIDIGDEQSIENDLSTYSSHLLNIKVLLQKATATTLFLIDELGSGTDPQYGGAIAETLIEYMAEKHAIGMVTTHFGNLKSLADHNPAIQNGAMLFDEKLFQPTFQLKIGQYGSSFTFEIAKKIGLNKQFVNRAKHKVGKNQIRYDFLLNKLQQKEKQLSEQEKLLTTKNKELDKLQTDFEQKNAELKQKRYEILHKAKHEASTILDNSNKLIEKTIRDIKENQNDKNAIKEIRQKLNAEKESLKISLKEEEQQAPPKNTNTTYKPHLHDIVIIKDSQVAGEITAINGEQIVVTFNSINFRTNIQNIEKTDKKIPSKHTSKSVVFKEIQEKAVNFELQLDLRGLRAEEAISELTYYLDDAILLNIKEFSILHGKGNGILRQVVRDFLANNRYVSHFQDAQPDSGGFGVTIVNLI